MTDMAGDSDSQLLRTDALRRVFTPAERRERLLDEFEHSGASGLKFARLAGIKYQTFASWVQRRRRERGAARQSKAPKDSAATVRWLEAVVEKSSAASSLHASVLQVHLPGGARMEITHAGQVTLAAALLQALHPPGAPC